MICIGIFLADGFEETEALVPADLLRRAGIKVKLISVTGRIEVVGAHDIRVSADLLFDESECEKLDMIMLPGGMPGTVNLEACTGLCSLVKKFADRNMPLAAICRAPTILGHMGILKGRRACCYPGFEEELEGAQRITTEDAVTDGNIITSRGAGCAIPFALAVISYFDGIGAFGSRGTGMAGKIAKSIVYGENER